MGKMAGEILTNPQPLPGATGVGILPTGIMRTVPTAWIAKVGANHLDPAVLIAGGGPGAEAGVAFMAAEGSADDVSHMQIPRWKLSEM